MRTGLLVEYGLFERLSVLRPLRLRHVSVRLLAWHLHDFLVHALGPRRREVDR